MVLHVFSHLEFNFTIENTKDCILFTEGNLRRLIHNVLSREYGSIWENDPSISWGKNKRDELKNRKDKRAVEFYAHTNSDRLIDYCYLYDLKDLLEKNKDLFVQIFKQWDKIISMFNIIGQLRNMAMHPHNIEVYQQHLCLGICGEFLQIIDAWELGKFRKIKKYACTMEWVDSSGGDRYVGLAKAVSQGQLWINKIRADAIGPIKNIVIQGRGSSAFEIPIKEGVIRVSTPYPAPRASPTATLYFESDSSTAFDKVLTEGDHGYRVLEWHMDDDLDIEKIIKRTVELTGRQGQYQRNPKGYDPKSKTYIESAEYSLLKEPGWELRVRIIGGNSNMGSAMSLIADSSNTDTYFRNAHNILSPEIILSFLYGEKGIPEIRKLLRLAAQPKSANP